MGYSGLNMGSTVTDRARSIVEYLSTSLDTPYHGSSSMTPTVYDTAWVAMVYKSEKRDGEKSEYWLFPECFQSILDSQSPEGGFGTHSTESDEIMNTMAALLALCKHEKNPSITGCPSVPAIAERSARGRDYLERKLQHWDVQSTVHVGFEILIPSLLDMLRIEGLDFRFPSLKALMALNKQKLVKFSTDILYSRQRTTLLHSLEAFIGKIDFDEVTHHLSFGAMMGSPSSTAAYLINSSRWNNDAEAYLRFVVDSGKGWVPSAFPITVFETTWVLSTLLESDFTSDDLGNNNVSKIADFLENQLQKHLGTTGFAPGILPDADDTAKAILSLNLLQRPQTCKKLIEAFEASTHFKTYNFESTESFSANCNVLVAIISSAHPSVHLPQISKALGFLCQVWYDGNLSDKWNLERQYSMMLLAGALTRVLKLWDSNDLADLPRDLIKHRIPLVTLQMLIQTLSAQTENGSWKDSPEITAYALLTLKRLGSLPWVKDLELKVNESIRHGTEFLEANELNWSNPEFIWVEKVTYGSRILSETYCVAAMQASSAFDWNKKASDLYKFPTKALDKFAHFFARLPIFANEPKWRLRASIIEGYLFSPILNDPQPQLDIFPKKNTGSSQYLQYIPFTWTTCNNANNFGMSTQTMCDMMIISMLNFQVDKYLEDVTEDQSLGGDFEGLKAVINRLFDGNGEKRSSNGHSNGHSKRRKLTNGTSELNGNGEVDHKTLNQSECLSDIEMTLSRFISYVLNHPKVSRSSDVLRRRIKDELLTFLQAHITHGEDNTRFQPPASPEAFPIFTSTTGTYYNWVRTTSADHTSCPYSFEFFISLIAQPGVDCFSGVLARYLAQDVCRHLATMCRQYNDYGSIARDRSENNLNSVNFPEFHEEDRSDRYADDGCTDSEKLTKLQADVRQKLFRIANYERECLDLALQKLKGEIDQPTWKALQVFIGVTDLYGQIYVIRDINSNATA